MNWQEMFFKNGEHLVTNDEARRRDEQGVENTYDNNLAIADYRDKEIGDVLQ